MIACLLSLGRGLSRSADMKSVRILIAATAALVIGTLVACEEKPKPTPTTTAPAAEEQNPMLDPDLGKAIAASSASGAKAGPVAPVDKDAPPATGVFPADQGNATHAAGAPVHIELGTPGSEPRVSLVPTMTELPKSLGVTVATMLGPRSSLPTVDMTFGLKVDQPKGKKEADAGAEGPIAVAAKLNKVVLSSQQPGQIPAEVATEVAHLKDSKVAWAFAPEGGATNITLERSAKARPELEHDLVAVAELVAASAIAAPKEPVGVGATWLARSRESYGGMDLISFRMYRVVKIEGDRVTLGVETRQYAVGSSFTKSGLPEGGELLQLEATATGELEIVRGHRFAERCKLTHSLRIGLRPQNAPENQIMPLMLQSTVTMPVQ